MDRSRLSVRAILQKNPFVTKSTVEKLLRIPAFRRQLSSALDTKYRRMVPVMADIPTTVKGRYVHFRIQDPKKFDPRSFRVIRLKGTDTKMTVACPKGSFIKGMCRVGMKPQSVLIPVSRVIALAGKYARLPKVRKIAANPLLMVAENKRKRLKTRRNPLLMVAANPGLNPCPFKENVKIPIAKFEGWLKHNGNPEEIKRYYEAKAKYRRFHLGAEPKTVSRNILKIGSKRITDRDFLYNAGVSPADLYKTASYSGKANAGSGYIHHWKDKPDVNITRDGKTIIKPLRGRARVDDWMRG